MRNGSRLIILSSVFHGAVSKTSNVLDILLMQLKLSICHPLTPSVTLAHSGGGDGDRGDSDGMMGCPAARKSTGNHCGETVLGFGEIKLVTIMTVWLGVVSAPQLYRACAVPWLCGSTQNTGADVWDVEPAAAPANRDTLFAGTAFTYSCSLLQLRK